MNPLQRLHHESANNRAALEQAFKCGCFHCLAEFAPNKITRWIDQDSTALCPACGIDTVIVTTPNEDTPVHPSAREFLANMNNYWFSEAAKA